MTDSQRFYDLFRKVASIEKRVSRLEDGYQELDNIVDPQGWIGEAFKLLEEDLEGVKTEMEGVKTEMEGVKTEIKTANNKLDIILKHLTGLSDT